MHDSVRKCDFLARYGGEEFIIFFPKTNCSVSLDIVEKLREKIEGWSFKINDKKNISLTCSFGVSSFNKNISIKKAILNADKALYKAKNAGRNQVVISHF